MVHGELLHHLPHVDVASSFILLPSSIRSAGESVADWLQNHWPLNEQAASEADPASSAPVLAAKKLKAEDVQRVVKFYAKDCPHSQALEPIWKAAEKDWKAANHDAKLIWQQKECYTSDWKKGKDFETCQAEGIESFPTIKYYYGKKDQLGEEILEHSDKDRLLDFVESRADPQAWDQKTAAFGLSAEQEDAGLSASWGDGQYMQPVNRYGGGRLVDYFSQDCVHCQHLKPVWKNAQRMWNEEHPGADNVQWEEKECFGKRWEPGKDYGECQAQGIHSFPTVRFHPYNSQEFEDFTAQRTAKNLLNFVDERAAPEAASFGHPAKPSPAPQAAETKGAEGAVENPPVAKAKVGKAQAEAAEVPEKVPKEPKTAEPKAAEVARPESPVAEVLKAKQADLKAPEQALAPCLAALVTPGQFRRTRSMQPMKEFL
ncbi:unnamed protein product [Cladocopium goreaui]|uniref:Thioredoxin domain-containing protein n=1 Tax=Cladocopium goreaui TaxID=2562237 RepID=A0A9P1CIZ5_9DINO|nr:unnamed protein product [Cladocopium goreaui]